MILHRILAISVIITLFLMITGTVALIFYVRGTNVTVLCSAKSSIIFQNEINKTVQLNIDSGLLNLSDGKIRIYNGGGSFRFTALNDTQITITHNIGQLRVQGDQNRELRIIKSGTSITVQTRNDVVITWKVPIEPLFPLMFILGIFGLCNIIGGSIYTICKVKKQDGYTGPLNGVIIIAFGISLFLAWLWAGLTV